MKDGGLLAAQGFHQGRRTVERGCANAACYYANGCCILLRRTRSAWRLTAWHGKLQDLKKWEQIRLDYLQRLVSERQNGSFSTEVPSDAMGLILLPTSCYERTCTHVMAPLKFRHRLNAELGRSRVARGARRRRLSASTPVRAGAQPDRLQATATCRSSIPHAWGSCTSCGGVGSDQAGMVVSHRTACPPPHNLPEGFFFLSGMPQLIRA